MTIMTTGIISIGIITHTSPRICSWPASAVLVSLGGTDGLDAEFHAVDSNYSYLAAWFHWGCRYRVPVLSVNEYGSRRSQRRARLRDQIDQRWFSHGDPGGARANRQRHQEHRDQGERHAHGQSGSQMDTQLGWSIDQQH